MHEIKLVSLLWIYTIQCYHYRDVFIALKNNKRNCLQKQLGFQEDEFGILRCHGRYANADISEETKFPKLLPRRNYFTQLLILEVHGRLVHAGISHTLSQLHQEYWIPQGRAEVRHVLQFANAMMDLHFLCQICHHGQKRECLNLSLLHT